jgi:NAD(P)-dependent dehydrogenase (short-subunit alcohol dehydrogenase family)
MPESNPFSLRGKVTRPGRVAQARDIAGAVIFHPGDASPSVTGANLPVDGGHPAK